MKGYFRWNNKGSYMEYGLSNGVQYINLSDELADHFGEKIALLIKQGNRVICNEKGILGIKKFQYPGCKKAKLLYDYTVNGVDINEILLDHENEEIDFKLKGTAKRERLGAEA